MSNPYVKNFLQLASERFSVDSVNMSNLEWLSRNTTLRNRPFSTKGYEFQNEIVNDMHPNMCVIKPSQVGITEIQIRKALCFILRNNGTSLIMTEPTEDMYKRVSSTRVKPLINKDKVFNTPQDRENKSSRSMDLMQFGQSFLYVVPALESSATSIPADAVFVDELDLSDQQMVALFSSRLQNSKYKITQRFSTPTFPSYGVDMEYQSSDQRTYMCRCPECNHWSHPEFTRDFIHLAGIPESLELIKVDKNYADMIDFDNSYIGCPKCHAQLDLDDPTLRQWVAKHPNRVHSRGYKIGPFSTGRLDIRYIYTSLWEYQKNEYVRGFYNTVLGMPYSDGNIQISEEAINSAMKEPTPPPLSGDLYIGIDVGQTAHIVIGKANGPEKMVILSMYTVNIHDLVEHCKTLMKNHNIVAGTIDRHPYEPTAREIFLTTGGVIVPVEYRGQKDTNLVYNEYDELSHAQVNQTWFLDQVATSIRKGLMEINGYGMSKRVIIEHYRDMVREETPGEPAKWKKLTGNDHFFHATGFMCVAPKIRELERLKNKEDVRTMALGVTTNIKNDASNLIGVSKKRIDNGPLSR